MITLEHLVAMILPVMVVLRSTSSSKDEATSDFSASYEIDFIQARKLRLVIWHRKFPKNGKCI
eukprot:scaffold12299_cov85-Cyclotella_meneghiniana.AAC.1